MLYVWNVYAFIVLAGIIYNLVEYIFEIYAEYQTIS